MTDKSNKRKPYDKHENTQAKRLKGYHDKTRACERAINNLALNGFQCFMSTVNFRLFDNWIDDGGIWKRKYDALVGYLKPKKIPYTSVISGGASGENLHAHIISTIDLEAAGFGDKYDLDIKTEPVYDAIGVSEYMLKNVLEPCVFLPRRWNENQSWKRWANPVIFYMHSQHAKNRVLFYYVSKCRFSPKIPSHIPPDLKRWHDRQIYQPVLFSNHHNPSKYPNQSTLLSWQIHKHDCDNVDANDYDVINHKFCHECKQWLPRTNTYFNYDRAPKLRADCKACARLGYTASRKRLGIDKRVLFGLKWSQKTKYFGSYVYRVFDYWKQNIEIDLFADAWHIDHIVPIALGGTSEPDNLCIVSQTTNQEKGDMPLDQWLAHLEAQGYSHPLMSGKKYAPLPL